MDFLDKHTLNRPLWYSTLDLFFLLALLGDWFISSNLFFWKKDSGKLIHSFLEGNCIAAMNGMLTVSFVTSTKMCQLLALQHTISFLTFYLHQSTQSILSPVDLYLIFEKLSCKNQFWGTGFLAWKNHFRNWLLLATQAVKIQFKIYLKFSS